MQILRMTSKLRPALRNILFPVLAATLLLAGQPSSSQQAPTISSEVKVVNMLATVRDKHGKIVPKLTKDDFTLEEDGRPQTIRYFSEVTGLPLTLGLLVDTSLSQRLVIDQERAASKNFLVQVLREDKDKAFLIHFDREVELSQDLTSSGQKLEAALDALNTPQLNPDRGSDSPDSSPGPGRGHGRRAAGTLLYDSIYLASNELMKKQTGRKAIIVLSDGVDRGSKEGLETAIESAQRADTLVYSILFKSDEEHRNRGGFSGPGMGRGGMGRHGGGGQRPQEPHPDGKKTLERISRETGGGFFEVSKKQTTEDIYNTIEQELRGQYSLGYTPQKTDASPAAGYHKILLQTKQKDLAVQTREGYYAEP
ncbi:MAG TPA: VWA domain-containing protein [Terriglobales bacterium]|nr:VWA domain-containing protein [Terriglobales bacterium]